MTLKERIEGKKRAFFSTAALAEVEHALQTLVLAGCPPTDLEQEEEKKEKKETREVN